MGKEPSFEYRGNFHIHTSCSDGGGSATHIAEVARRVGLDFIALNDHASQTPLHLEAEGYHRGVLVLVGSEIGTRYHHYLAYNITRQVTDERLSPQQVIDAVKSQGGFGFVAHPFEKGMPFREKSVAYTWNDWSVSGYTGICIWNFTSRWKENVTSAWRGLFHLVFKKYTLKGPSNETLATWDKLCRERRVAALGGSDAHGARMRFGLLRFTPLTYRYLLGTIATHVLTTSPLEGNVETDKQLIYDALKAGNCFVAHDGLSPAKGFTFSFVRDETGEHLEMGEEGTFSPGTLLVTLPRHGLIRIIRDGSLLEREYGSDLSLTVSERGVYRVEAFQKTLFFGWRPWIFSNPIYLR